MNRIMFAIAAAMAAIFLLAGCDAAHTGKAVQEDSIRIGALLSLTGGGAYYGELNYRGVDLAVDLINQQGGIGGKDLEIVLEDTETSSATATVALQKLAGIDDVPVVIGPADSQITLAVA